MKTFTIKDFINYNGPCFSCKSKINFRVGVSIVNSQQPSIYLVPTVTNDFIEIDLKHKYNSELKLKIFPKTNKFSTSNTARLIKYLDDKKLSLRSRCDGCGTNIDSESLEFNFLQCFIKPVGICDEKLVVTHDKHLYEVYSYFTDNRSTIVFIKIDSNEDGKWVSLPLLPLYKFKNKEKFLEKIKTYILFS